MPFNFLRTISLRASGCRMGQTDAWDATGATQRFTVQIRDDGSGLDYFNANGCCMR